MARRIGSARNCVGTLYNDVFIFNVIVVNFDPLTSDGVTRLHEYMGWNDPKGFSLSQWSTWPSYCYRPSRDIMDATWSPDRSRYSQIKPVIVDWIDIDEFPYQAGYDENGNWFSSRFTNEQEYRACFNAASGADCGADCNLCFCNYDYDETTGTWRLDGCAEVDYEWMLDIVSPAYGQTLRQLIGTTEDSEVDEIWIWSAPFLGGSESRQIGNPVYSGLNNLMNVNAPPRHVDDIRPTVVMQWSYQRGTPEMNEALQHRIDTCIDYFYGRPAVTSTDTHWAQFCAVHRNVAPEPAGTGRGHEPPNARWDRDYSNPEYVEAYWGAWKYYPNFEAHGTEMVSCNYPSSYCGNSENYFLSRWDKIPKYDGWTTGTENGTGSPKVNHWWEYVFNFNQYTEGGGPAPIPGGLGPMPGYPG